MKIVLTTCSKRLRWSLGLAAALAGATVMAQLLIPAQWQPHCGFHALTGLPCPTCGATRCGELLFAGRWLEAARMQPLLFGLAILLIPLLLYSIPALLFNWRLPSIRLEGRSDRLQIAVAIIFLVLANWAYLLLRHT